MSKVKVKQTRSAINRDKSQKATLVALGLKKLNHISLSKILNVNFVDL